MKRNTIQTAAASVHIACADLILAGYHAITAPEGLAYDVVLDASGQLYRMQVKSCSQPVSRDRPTAPKAYKFVTTRNHRPEMHGQKADVRQYTSAEIDIMACVALDIRKVAYFRVTGTFLSGLHLYPPGTLAFVRSGINQRRCIDEFPIAKALEHKGAPTLAYAP